MLVVFAWAPSRPSHHRAGKWALCWAEQLLGSSGYRHQLCGLRWRYSDGRMLRVCSCLEAADCINPGIPAPISFQGLLFPCPATINQAGRAAAAGLVLSRSVFSLPEVISGEPGGICHLPTGLCPASSRASPFNPAALGSGSRGWDQ